MPYIRLPAIQQDTPLYGSTHRLIERKVQAVQRDKLVKLMLYRAGDGIVLTDGYGEPVRFSSSLAFEGSQRGISGQLPAARPIAKELARLESIIDAEVMALRAQTPSRLKRAIENGGLASLSKLVFGALNLAG